MRQIILLAACGIALAACGQSATPPPDPAAAAQIGEAQPLERTLPPSSATPRYVGAWSTTAEGCDHPAWIINAHEMHTEGEVSCTFNDVSDIAGGYNIFATCSAEGEVKPYAMQVTFAESAQAMMIAGGPWSPDPGLLYCGAAP